MRSSPRADYDDMIHDEPMTLRRKITLSVIAAAVIFWVLM